MSRRTDVLGIIRNDETNALRCMRPAGLGEDPNSVTTFVSVSRDLLTHGGFTAPGEADDLAVVTLWQRGGIGSPWTALKHYLAAGTLSDHLPLGDAMLGRFGEEE